MFGIFSALYFWLSLMMALTYGEQRGFDSTTVSYNRAYQSYAWHLKRLVRTTRGLSELSVLLIEPMNVTSSNERMQERSKVWQQAAVWHLAAVWLHKR